MSISVHTFFTPQNLSTGDVDKFSTLSTFSIAGYITGYIILT